MNFVEYTEDKILKIFESFKKQVPRILVIGAGYKIPATSTGFVVQHDPKKDIAEWICEFRDTDKFTDLFDVVIASRIFEHIPIRNIDWYLCCLYSVMKQNGKLICVVPDMSKVAEALDEEFSKPVKDQFKIHRLHFELFSEGPSIWDRHACWMTPNSIKYFLEMEGLFTVQEMINVRIDSDIIPNEIEVTAIRK